VLKLGRKPSRRDRRTLQFSRYISMRALPASPPARDWAHPITAPAWGLFSNDRLGDCTCAAIGHYLQAMAANTGRPLAITGGDVIRMYQAVGGYDPTRPETDAGCEMLDVLRYMRATGLCGYRFGAFVQVDPLSRTYVEAAINALGGLYAGLDLPVAWQNATTWDVAPIGDRSTSYAPNTWGPHAVEVVGYDRLGLMVVTWGVLKILTWEALRKYCSEAWAMIDSLWIDDTSMLSPSGFDLETLMRDLVEIDRK
jgi:hypothetical protein